MLSKLAVYSIEWFDGEIEYWTAADPIIALRRAVSERNREADTDDRWPWHARHIHSVLLVGVLDRPSPRPTTAPTQPRSSP